MANSFIAYINRQSLMLDGETGRLIGEASTLGLAPGCWPDHIEMAAGNNKGVMFERTAYEKDAEGDLISWTYMSLGQPRLTLQILND